MKYNKIKPEITLKIIIPIIAAALVSLQCKYLIKKSRLLFCYGESVTGECSNF